MAKYDITKEATEDLYKIWAYTVDTWSEEQADTYYSLLEAGMNEVASAPERVDLRCEERQRCVSAVNLRIADSRLLDAHLGGIGNGVTHTIVEGQCSSLAAGADCLSKRQGCNYTLNEKVSHFDTNC